jgi:hypothetical protein
MALSYSRLPASSDRALSHCVMLSKHPDVCQMISRATSPALDFSAFFCPRRMAGWT